MTFDHTIFDWAGSTCLALVCFQWVMISIVYACVRELKVTTHAQASQPRSSPCPCWLAALCMHTCAQSCIEYQPTCALNLRSSVTDTKITAHTRRRTADAPTSGGGPWAPEPARAAAAAAAPAARLPRVGHPLHAARGALPAPCLQRPRPAAAAWPPPVRTHTQTNKHTRSNTNERPDAPADGARDMTSVLH